MMSAPFKLPPSDYSYINDICLYLPIEVQVVVQEVDKP